MACSLHQHLRYHQLVLPASVLPHSEPGAKCSSNVTGPGDKNICIVMWKSQFQHQHRHKHHDRTHSHRSVHGHYISVVLFVVVVNITVFLMSLITCCFVVFWMRSSCSSPISFSSFLFIFFFILSCILLSIFEFTLSSVYSSSFYSVFILLLFICVPFCFLHHFHFTFTVLFIIFYSFWTALLSLQS